MPAGEAALDEASSCLVATRCRRLEAEEWISACARIDARMRNERPVRRGGTHRGVAYSAARSGPKRECRSASRSGRTVREEAGNKVAGDL